MRTRIRILALAVLASTSSATSAQALFCEPLRLVTGDEPTDVVAADITGDGHPDLLVANQASGTLSAFAGDGQGGFAAFGTFAAGKQPNSLATADFDGDGDLDVAVANHDTLVLTLLENKGSGRFEPAPSSPLGLPVRPHPHVVRAADMNQDGQPDLLVDDREGRRIAVLAGRGGLTFELPGTRITVGGDPYLGMVVTDLNDDDRPDLITPNSAQVAVVLSGASGYGPPVMYPLPRAFAADTGDFNGDGRPDLLMASESGLVQLHLGLGGGRFETQAAASWRGEAGARQLRTGDIDGDGKDDAVVQNWSSTELLVIRGAEGSPHTSMLRGGETPWGLTLADLNGDGCADLVSLDYANDTALVYISCPD